MAFQPLVGRPQCSPDVQACELEAHRHQSNSKHGLVLGSLEESERSVCSTQAPTAESLPAFSQEAPLDGVDDANDWEHVIPEIPTNGKAQLCKGLSSPMHIARSGELQGVVDKIFTNGAPSLLGLDFPLAIADPLLEGCPLVGCSAGFTALYGYEMDDVVGLHCSFALDPVPAQQVDVSVQCHRRDFCLAAAEGTPYRMQSNGRDAWVSQDRPWDELIAVQKSCRKDGTLFDSMFLMSIIGLGDFEDEQSYVIILESEVLGGRSDLQSLSKQLVQLDKNMTAVEKILGKEFIISGSMRRQDIDSEDDLDS